MNETHNYENDFYNRFPDFKQNPNKWPIIPKYNARKVLNKKKGHFLVDVFNFLEKIIEEEFEYTKKSDNLVDVKKINE